MTVGTARLRAFALIIPCALIVSACSRSYDAPPNPEAPDRDVEQVVEGNTAFAVDLYQELRTRDGNIFFSPHSISTALGMAYVGARGETADEMKQTLHFDLPAEKQHSALGTLAYQLHQAAEDGDVELRIANRLWGDDTLTPHQSFLDTTSANYGSAYEEADFSDIEAIREEVNEWAADQTNDRIRNIFPRGVLDSDTRLIGASAIYFKGKWDEPFKKRYTRDEPFYVTPDSPIDVSMMHQTEDFRFHRSDFVHVLEMPYEGKRLAMLLILPTERGKLADVEEALTTERLNEWIDAMRHEEVIVTLPKFEFRQTLDLERVLAPMGIPSAFSPGSADFSGITKAERLHIGVLMHQAYVKVDEEGTEAAAATAWTNDGSAEMQEPPTFKADQPFIFMIRDRETGAILFMGRVSDPTEGGPAG